MGKKRLVVNGFVEMCKSLQVTVVVTGSFTKADNVSSGSDHQSPGLWRHQSWRFTDVNHWVELAKLLEKAKFHGIFIADVLGGYDVYKQSLDPAVISGAQWPVNEPLSVIPQWQLQLAISASV